MHVAEVELFLVPCWQVRVLRTSLLCRLSTCNWENSLLGVDSSMGNLHTKFVSF